MGADAIANRNWSKNKRVFVGFLISLLTFSVYIGSAVYTSCESSLARSLGSRSRRSSTAIPGLMQRFNASLTVATLGLTLFVLAYGIGPSTSSLSLSCSSRANVSHSVPRASPGNALNRS